MKRIAIQKRQYKIITIQYDGCHDRQSSAQGFEQGGGVVGVRTRCYLASYWPNRLKLSNERLERTHTYHTSYTSPCLKPSAQS